MRIKSRRIDLSRKGLASGDRVLDHTSIDQPLSDNEDGYSLASTISGRELTPDQALIIKEDAQRQGNVNDARLACAIEKLPAKQRQALLLRLEPNTYKQIAEKMGETESNVKTLLHRATVRLKELLNEEDA